MTTSYQFSQLINFTNTTTASFVGSNGLVQMTQASRNLLTFTQEFDNAVWTKSGVAAYPFNPSETTLGPELVTNGDFSSGSTGWTTPITGASITGGALVFDGVTSITAGPPITTNTPTAAIVTGKTYQVTYTIIGGTTLPVSVTLGGGTATERTAAGTYTEYVVAISNAAPIVVPRINTGARTGSIDNISIREVLGGLITAPDGTPTAETIMTTTNTGSQMYQTLTNIGAGVYNYSIYVKRGSGDTDSNDFAIANNTTTGNYARVEVNYATGAIISQTFGSGATMTAVGNDWWRLNIPFASTAALGNNIRVYAGTIGTVQDPGQFFYAWGAQVELVPSENVVLGSELWTSPTPTITNSAGTVGVYNTGTLTMTNTGSTVAGFPRFNFNLGLVSGKAYRVTGVLTGSISQLNVLRLATIGTVNNISYNSATGVFSSDVIAGSNILQIVTDLDGVESLTISSLSVKEITGTVDMPTAYTRNVGGRFPPRFDYDPITLQPRGILIEEQRTNRLLQTEDFATSWTPTNATVSSNVATSPDGTVDADKIVEDTSNTSHFINQIVSSIAGSANVAVSIYAKAAGRNFLAIVTRDSANTFRTSYFNISNGTLGTIATGHTASIQPLGNNWYRCMIVTTQSATTGNFTFYPSITDVNGSVTYQGDGTSGIFVWGAQLEVGAFATSYIPNVATAGGVIRAPDQASIVAPMFALWYNQTEGTFVWEYSRVAPPNGGRVFASGVGGSNSYGIWVNTATGSQDQVTVRDISGDAVAGVSFSINSTGRNKGAVAYKNDDFAWASNGASPATDNTGVVPSLSDQLRLGRAINTDASYLNGHIRSIRYYPERLSNARLQELSTL